MQATWLNKNCIFNWSAPLLEDDGVTLLTDKLKELERKYDKIGVPWGHE